MYSLAKALPVMRIFLKQGVTDVDSENDLAFRTNHILYFAVTASDRNRLYGCLDRAAGVLFAVGAVSGTILSFEMGVLWPTSS